MPDNTPDRPCVAVILLPDLLDADGLPRAAVLRPGLPPLAFPSVRAAVAEAAAREAAR